MHTVSPDTQATSPDPELSLIEDDALTLKGDPVDGMRLRPDPPRVTRLSSKALLTLALLTSCGLGGVLIYALMPQHKTQPQAQEAAPVETRAPPDGLNTLPRDYTGPILGPPLPGDLGRPILEARQRGQHVPVPEMGPEMATSPYATAYGPSDTPLPPDPEQQRQQQETEAARTAHLFAPSDTASASQLPDMSIAYPISATMPLEAGAATTPPSVQEQQKQFLERPTDPHTLSEGRLTPPASAHMLHAGAIIPGALVTGIRSDLPGPVIGQVTQTVYDSLNGRTVLIPQGTRLIGTYDNSVGFGQSRVLLVWNRMIFPNGHSITLERQPGTDPQGYAGLKDGVDYHGWGMAKAAGLSTLLAMGAELVTDDSDRLLRALRDGAQDTLTTTGQQIIQRQLSVQPTLTVRPGFAMRIILTRDLILPPYGD